MEKNINLAMKILKNLEKQIKNDYKAEIVGVFGSYVRGEQRERSDLDILAKFFKSATLFDFVRLGFFLEEKLKIKVDIVPVDTLRKEIKKQVLKEAIYL